MPEHYSRCLPIRLINRKKELTEIEISTVEAICARGMQKYGYKLSLSKAKRVKGYFCSRALLLADQSESKARETFRKVHN